MLRLGLGLALIVAFGQSAQAASVRGTVKLPKQFEPHRSHNISGYWKFPNNVLSILPPLVDIRHSMVIVLEGGKNGSTVPPTLAIKDAQFSPRVLPVAPGTSVSFTNKDSTLHLLESKDQFPVKRLGPGGSFRHTFVKAGAHSVRCTEIPHVEAQVFVTTGRVTLPNDQGAFYLPNVDPGQYVIKVWYYGSWLHTQPINVSGKLTSIDIQLAPRKAEAATTGKE